MSNKDLVKNIMRGAYRFLPYILEQIDVSKVRQIAIKGYNSPSLPIYNYLSPEEVAVFQKFKKEKKFETVEKWSYLYDYTFINHQTGKEKIISSSQKFIMATLFIFCT